MKRKVVRKVDVAIFSNAIHFRTENCRREKLGTANNEMVADESIKKKGIDIGDTIIDPVSKNLQSLDLQRIKCLAIHQSFM